MAVLTRVRAALSSDSLAYSQARFQSRGRFAEDLLDNVLYFIRRCERCPVAFPWFYGDQHDVVQQLHCLSLRVGDNRTWKNPVARFLSNSLQFVLWPFVVPAVAAVFVRKYGPSVQATFVLSRLTLWRRLVAMAFRRNIPPTEAITIRLFLMPGDPRVGGYILQREKDPVLHRLDPANRQRDLVHNKHRFCQHCIDHGLNTPQTVATFNNEGVPEDWIDAAHRLPRVDLFLKPIAFAGGRGAMRWEYLPGDEPRWTSGGVVLDEDGLIAKCREMPCMLQKVLKTGPELADLSPKSLPTFRLITLQFANGHREVALAVLRLPVGEMVVDNFSAGGLVIAIDLETGELGRAFGKKPKLHGLTVHPDTGGQIYQREIPSWPLIKDLALRAHATLPELHSVGWDIAVTTEGLSIVEANRGWAFEMIQISMGRGLTESAFLDWAEERLLAAEPASTLAAGTN